jgi:ketosteroid isomerase-like protein
VATVDELSDQLAIRDLLAGFADAVNRMAPDMLRALFTDDGEWAVPGFGEPRGHDAIVDFLVGLLVKWDVIFHAIHSGRVQLPLDGDPDRASGQWYISEFGKLLDGTEVRFAGVYHDDYERGTDGVWRFARRRYDGMFTRLGGRLEVRPFPADLA